MNPFNSNILEVDVTIEDFANKGSYHTGNECLLATAIKRIFKLNSGDLHVSHNKVIFYRKNPWFWQKRYKEFRLDFTDDLAIRTADKAVSFTPFKIMLNAL